MAGRQTTEGSTGSSKGRSAGGPTATGKRPKQPQNQQAAATGALDSDSGDSDDEIEDEMLEEDLDEEEDELEEENEEAPQAKRRH